LNACLRLASPGLMRLIVESFRDPVIEEIPFYPSGQFACVRLMAPALMRLIVEPFRDPVIEEIPFHQTGQFACVRLMAPALMRLIVESFRDAEQEANTVQRSSAPRRNNTPAQISPDHVG